MRTWMPAVRTLIPVSLRRRLAVALACAIAAACVAADPVRKPYTAPAVPQTSFWDDLSNFALTWGPLIFMGLICALIAMTMRFMPRTKPQEIKPDSSSSIYWDDVAGADEAKAELREVVEFL